MNLEYVRGVALRRFPWLEGQSFSVTPDRHPSTPLDVPTSPAPSMRYSADGEDRPYLVTDPEGTALARFYLTEHREYTAEVCALGPDDACMGVVHARNLSAPRLRKALDALVGPAPREKPARARTVPWAEYQRLRDELTTTCRAWGAAREAIERERVDIYQAGYQAGRASVREITD